MLAHVEAVLVVVVIVRSEKLKLKVEVEVEVEADARAASFPTKIQLIVSFHSICNRNATKFPSLQRAIESITAIDARLSHRVNNLLSI